jgi:hypothetical protein
MVAAAPRRPSVSAAAGSLRPSTVRHWPEAAAVPVAEYERGPVLVTVEYRVPADRAADFPAAVGPLRAAPARGRSAGTCSGRRRRGRSSVFLLEWWVDHLRQHERVTDEDGARGGRPRARR